LETVPVLNLLITPQPRPARNSRKTHDEVRMNGAFLVPPVICLVGCRIRRKLRQDRGSLDLVCFLGGGVEERNLAEEAGIKAANVTNAVSLTLKRDRYDD